MKAHLFPVIHAFAHKALTFWDLNKNSECLSRTIFVVVNSVSRQVAQRHGRGASEILTH